MQLETLFEGLTDAQRAAVAHVDGPLLVLAGPGSGKTTVVTRRVAALIAQGIPPWQILALTFTNKAAGEMRHRIEALVPEDIAGRRGLTVATFHSFCVRVLRRYAEHAGLPPRFTIYDSADQRSAIKQALEAAQLNSQNWPPAGVHGAISNAKNQLLDAAAFAKQANDFYERSIAKAYEAYQRILTRNDALDFDDLLLRTARLLRDSEPVRRELQQRYQYVLIDEYQDTNRAQFLIAHVLAAEHRNICVVGDPDQSIYGWRGADLNNILDFEEHYPSATVVPLGQNFRSTDHIVQTAAELIGHNMRRRHKVLSTELGPGEKPQLVCCRDEHHEAAVIVDELRRRHDDQEIPWREMAVLYRVNALSRVIEDHFRREGVPYHVARGTAFYQRKEVKDALAYLRLVANPADEVSLRRIINDPPRSIGSTTLQRVESVAMSRQMTLAEALWRTHEFDALPARAAGSIAAFTTMVDTWRHAAAAPALPPKGANDPGPLAELVGRVIRESGMEKHYRSSRVEEEQERVANLEELVSAAAEFRMPLEEGIDPAEAEGAPPSVLDQLASFLESVTLVSDADTIDAGGGAVTLMTLHTAKGLEFDAVAIAGLEEGILPHSRAARDEGEREEERRLCFVGITRARRHLLLTRARRRTHRGLVETTIESGFVRELPAQHVTSIDMSDEVDFGDPGWEPWYEGKGPPPGPRSSRRAATATAGTRASSGGYTVGCTVRHPTFGIGRIERLMPRPVGSAAIIAFKTAGTKTLILEHAKLEVVG